MELTTSEQKILDTARKYSGEHRSIASYPGSGRKWWFAVALVGGSMLLIYGLTGLFSRWPDAIQAISSGLLVIGYSGIMYEKMRFTHAAHHQIRKLASENSGEVIATADPGNAVSAVFFACMIAGVVGVIITLVYMVIGWMAEDHNTLAIRGGFWTIVLGSQVIGFSAVMLEYFGFRRAALSLLKKLQMKR